jgi:hypothetical protein
VLVAIAWIIRAHHVHLRIGGNAPITLQEVREIYPAADSLRDDPGDRAGVFVHDADGGQLGYVVCTMPHVKSIIGYRGWTDALIAFDPALRVLGVRIRSTQDTREHAADVKGDSYFLKTWNGKPWDEIARTSPEEAGIEGVSGATLTSMAVAEGITRRLAAANEALAIRPQPLRFSTHDIGLALVIAAAIALAFTGTHRRPWLRRGFQVLVIAYVGLITGGLLAQSLMAGWAQSGVPWRSAPSLVLMLAAALAVPWASGKPLYCQHLCPHGAAQELLHRAAPRRWRIALRKDVDSGLRWLPPGLLAVVITVTMLALPLDLAHIEPFDAYILRSAGWATIAIAVAGLIASLFVPMAYCHYGCPTGALLNFIRRHGVADRFTRSDFTALVLVVLAAVVMWKYQAIHAWIVAWE